MRLFVSIDLPEKVQKKLHGWLPDQLGLRYTREEQLHLTLLFLGECTTRQKNEIIGKLSGIIFNPFELTISGLGAFPDRKDPRVIWAGVKEHTELLKLQNHISSTLKDFTEENENREFHPHITLARTNKRFVYKQNDQLFEPGESISFNVDFFSLKKSVLSPEGSMHSVLNKFRANNNSDE